MWILDNVGLFSSRSAGLKIQVLQKNKIVYDATHWKYRLFIFFGIISYFHVLRILLPQNPFFAAWCRIFCSWRRTHAAAGPPPRAAKSPRARNSWGRHPRRRESLGTQSLGCGLAVHVILFLANFCANIFQRATNCQMFAYIWQIWESTLLNLSKFASISPTFGNLQPNLETSDRKLGKLKSV